MMANILIVDDEEEIRNLSSELLSAEGFSVDTAADGHEAIEKAAAKQYDVALVDLVLPGGLNGIDIITKLRQISSNTRIVAFTGFSGANIAERTARAGADGFMTKPFFSNRLIQTVNKWAKESANNGNGNGNGKRADTILVKQAKPSQNPLILNGFSDRDIRELLSLGQRKLLGTGEKVGVDCRKEIVILRQGRSKCYYQDFAVATLEANEAVGEACIFLRNNQDIRLTLTAEGRVELLIIDKEKLKHFFAQHNPSLFLRFSANIILNLSRRLIQCYDLLVEEKVALAH
jgi:CheY-like chemotaxis protein